MTVADALIVRKIVLVLNCLYSEIPLLSECSGLFAVDLHQKWPYVECPYKGEVTVLLLCSAGLVFDWLYPRHFPVICLCLEAWADTPEVTTAMLKFIAEFVMNKQTRLAFDSSSPNGILLFREVSKVIAH